MVGFFARGGEAAYANGGVKAMTETPVTPGSMKPSEFAKKLRWLITNPPKDAVRWLITPPMASEMLTWNLANRPLSEPTIKEKQAAMEAERHPYTGDPVRFSTSRLLDGQHRLHACVRSGRCFEALVVFGVPDESFAYIDIGKKRSASDVFAIYGVKNWNLMAAAVQWVAGYENGTIGTAAKGTMRLDHAALYQEYKKHERLQESAWVGFLFGPLKMGSPSTMTALHYLCAKKNRQQADAFFRQVAEGIGFSSKKEPAYKLRQRLISSSKTEEKLGRKAFAAVVIKAWNALRLNRPVGDLEYGADEAFPRIV